MAAEPANAQAGSVQRQRRNDGVDARSVLKPRVDNRLRLVDAAAHLRDDLLDDVQQVRVVLEPHRGLRELSVSLDVNLVVAVHQNVGNAGLFEQRFERPQPQHFVQDFLHDLGLLGRGHGHALFVEQPLHHAADLGADPVFGDG